MKISVALATYNGEMYILKQLQSIAEQTLLPFELIISDDCSTDSTYSIICNFAEIAPFDVKISQNDVNIGYVKNFEKAILQCTGDYIALADQDDIWALHKIQTLVSEIGDNFLIHTDAILIDDMGKVLHASYTNYSGKYLGRDFIQYLACNNVTGCTMMFKKDLVRHVLPFPDDFPFHDWWIALHAVYLKKIKYCDKKLIYYRQHGLNQVGAKISSEHIGELDFESKKRQYFNSMTALRIIRDLGCFSMYYDKAIDDFLNYYKRYFIYNFSIRSFIFRIKYFSYFLRNYSFFVRFLGAFGAMFGFHLQLKIYRIFQFFYKKM